MERYGKSEVGSAVPILPRVAMLYVFRSACSNLPISSTTTQMRQHETLIRQADLIDHDTRVSVFNSDHWTLELWE